MKPSIQDIDNAKIYAKRKIYNINVLSDKIKKEYIKSFSKILLLVYQQGYSPSFFQFEKYMGLNNQVDNEINLLSLKLYKLIEDASIDIVRLSKEKNRQNDDIDIIGYINKPYNGKDLNMRLGDYCSGSKMEFEGYIAAALILSKPINIVLNDFKANLGNIYASSIIRDAMADKSGRIASKMILNKGISYGIGKYKNSLNSLIRLGRAIPNYAFGYVDEIYMRQSGAIGYYVLRGSSYPCQACDDVVGFYDLRLNSEVLPVHPNCMCFAVPVYN
jgi:hypothetical protein